MHYHIPQKNLLARKNCSRTPINIISLSTCIILTCELIVRGKSRVRVVSDYRLMASKWIAWKKILFFSSVLSTYSYNWVRICTHNIQLYPGNSSLWDELSFSTFPHWEKFTNTLEYICVWNMNIINHSIFKFIEKCSPISVVMCWSE